MMCCLDCLKWCSNTSVMDSIHTDQLQTKTVRQLCQLCKAQRIKNYAWASKIELIFLLLDLTTECICCEHKLTSEEMATYLENQEGGDNCWIDDEHGAVPCCTSCDKYKPALCHLCGAYWADHSLEWADLSGEEILICHECHLCSNCNEQFGHRITTDNWMNSSLVCNNCCPSTCCMCNQIYHSDNIYLEKSKDNKDIFICESCKECGTCAASMADTPISKYNWDTENDILCNSCLKQYKLTKLTNLLNKWEEVCTILNSIKDSEKRLQQD
jgi:hypothetical protein